ncbi:MAG: hypothetical protein V4515_15020 [Chloroflexota bacterium]
MDDTERFNLTWNRAYDSGYRSGYMDAIGELWTLERKAFDAGDLAKANLISDLIQDVRDREAAVVERNKQLLAEAAAKNS